MVQTAQSTTATQNTLTADTLELCTFDQIAERHKYTLTPEQLRHALRFRDQNGLRDAMRRTGKGTYIHGPTFANWLAAR